MVGTSSRMSKEFWERLFENISANKIHAPLRYDMFGKPFLNDVKHFNMTNPFKTMWQGVLTSQDIQNEYISADGINLYVLEFRQRKQISIVSLPVK